MNKLTNRNKNENKNLSPMELALKHVKIIYLHFH